MELTIRHTTTYRYEEPVPAGLLEVRLRPRTQPLQSVESWEVELAGATSQATFYDEYANSVELVSVERDATEVAVTVGGKVVTADAAGISSSQPGTEPLWLYLRPTPLTEVGPHLTALCDEVSTDDGALGSLHALSALLAERIDYVPGDTLVGTTAEEAAALGRGVCQDHAHAFIAAARALGHPARYVSGYLLMGDDDQQAMHAWAEAWVEGLGWVGFDPPNGISPDTRYVRVAKGLDYQAAAPMRGVRFGSSPEHLSVVVQVQQ